ncbi:uncharacterized protein LOC110723789 [Chenopodium quinoa]|uniref:uncharacterized protein LOC110723789 n=1 Tax=Chenopodium quinoa TaxID=63459 RepID=UPI000B777C26|nr:uncharacterized protein LOC110723789 [Chenopodium quinoa]XP_021758854.1 uncharacterized protein LOC110723789 [Chenopodium quinoa]
MKGIKAKSIPQKKVITDYERQRLEQLKRNADIMATSGKGTLASQIYDKSRAFSYALNAISTWDDNNLFSDEDDENDDEYILEYEGNQDEIDSGTITSKRKAVVSGKFCGGSTRGMPPLSHLPHVKDIATKKASRKGSSNKSGSMAAFVQNTTKHGVENHTELPPVNSVGKFQQRDHQNGNNPSGKQALQPQKKHQQKTFCRPGSLTAFRELRKNQSENMIQDNETNSTSNLEVAYEGQLISSSANDIVNEQPVDDGNNVIENITEAIDEEIEN